MSSTSVRRMTLLVSPRSKASSSWRSVAVGAMSSRVRAAAQSLTND
jgi:hypothetical protein